MTTNIELTTYKNYFNNQSFFDKVKSLGKKAGENLLIPVLILWFLIKDKQIPFKTRLIFISALGYFIIPSDLISDFIPALGFADDLSFITYALSQGRKYITPKIMDEAKAKSKSILGKNKSYN